MTEYAYSIFDEPEHELMDPLLQECDNPLDAWDAMRRLARDHKGVFLVHMPSEKCIAYMNEVGDPVILSKEFRVLLQQSLSDALDAVAAAKAGDGRSDP